MRPKGGKKQVRNLLRTFDVQVMVRGKGSGGVANGESRFLNHASSFDQLGPSIIPGSFGQPTKDPSMRLTCMLCAPGRVIAFLDFC